MRFLKLLVSYLLIGGILLSAAVLVVMLVLSYSQVLVLTTALAQAKQLSRKPSHAQECLLPEVTDQYPLAGYQVRFENEKEYVVEALCASNVKGPFVVSRHALQLGVRKVPAYSGVLFATTGAQNSVGRIAVKLGYVTWVLETGETARTKTKPYIGSAPVLPPAGESPAKATCEGWGYYCCNSLTQVGVGVSQSGNVTACYDSCYTSCLERPSILVFSTDADAFNVTSREVVVKKSSPLVVFSYSVQDVDGASMLVTIDYGDGQTGESSNQTDQFSHVYACNKATCVYDVKLKVIDSDGLENTQTRISDMRVYMR